MSIPRVHIMCFYHILSDPYNLVPKNYMGWMFGALLVLNIFNLLELSTLYGEEDINAPFECTFEEGLVFGFPQVCVVYFELMGANTSVLLSMLFINMAVYSRPTRPKQHDNQCNVPSANKRHPEAGVNSGSTSFIDRSTDTAREFLEGISASTGGKQFGESRQSSLKKLEALAISSTCFEVKMYYKHAIDVIKEVRESEAPNKMPNGFFKWECCGRTWFPPTKNMLGVWLLNTLFVLTLTFISLFTHPDAYWHQLKSHWFFVFGVVSCYFFVGWFLFLHCTVMRRITMILQKAYALMKISTDPMNFLQNAKTGNTQPQNVNSDDPFHYYLNEEMRIVTPEFLRAWWSLRNHIQQWELRYFYEVCFERICIYIVLCVPISIVFACGCHSTADSADYFAGDCVCFVHDIDGINWYISRGI